MNYIDINLENKIKSILNDFINDKSDIHFYIIKESSYYNFLFFVDETPVQILVSCSDVFRLKNICMKYTSQYINYISLYTMHLSIISSLIIKLEDKFKISLGDIIYGL